MNWFKKSQKKTWPDNWLPSLLFMLPDQIQQFNDFRFNILEVKRPTVNMATFPIHTKYNLDYVINVRRRDKAFQITVMPDSMDRVVQSQNYSDETADPLTMVQNSLYSINNDINRSIV